MRKTLIAIAAMAATTALSGTAHADTLVGWSLAGAPGSQTSTAGSTGQSGITAGDLVRGAGLTASNAANSFSATGWDNKATDYFSFGFSIDAGYRADLESLYIGTRSSNTGPGMLGLYWSGDSFATAITTFTQSGSAFNNSVTDLSALSGLAGSVEFRIAQIGTASANGGTTAGTGTFRVTDYFTSLGFDRSMQITGTVSAVPEPGPATLLLAGLAAVGFVASRRRG